MSPPKPDIAGDDAADGAPAAIVLAAGASRRMGRNKMLLRIGEESLVRRAVRNAIDAGCSPVLVVTGRDAEAVRDELAALPCRCVTNPDFTGPTSGSLHCGLAALPPECDAVVIVLADMPFVTAAMLASLVVAARTPGGALAASRYADVLAPPLMFRRSLFGELLDWHGEGCGKQVVQQHQEEALLFDWPAEALVDIDTPADYEAVRTL